VMDEVIAKIKQEYAALRAQWQRNAAHRGRRHLYHWHITLAGYQRFPFVYEGVDEQGREWWRCPFDGGFVTRRRA
jgi:hypothetical protein